MLGKHGTGFGNLSCQLGFFLKQIDQMKEIAEETFYMIRQQLIRCATSEKNTLHQIIGIAGQTLWTPIYETSSNCCGIAERKLFII